MLVAADKMLKDALKGKYAVGQFNINNLEWTKAILETAQENNSPVILGVSEGAGKYMGGYKTVVGMVKGMIEELNITVPVAIHLDHGSFEGAKKCIEAGFTSVMFDGSKYPIDENIEKTKEIVMDLKKFNKEEKVIKSRILLYTIARLLGSTKGIEKIHIEDVIKMCSNNIGNKYLTPNKNIKILLKNHKIYFISQK